MPHFRRRLIIGTAILACATACSSADAALVEYSYTGKMFDDAFAQPYTRVTVAFILDDSLVPRGGHFALTIRSPSLPDFPLTQFTFSDGVNIIAKLPPQGYSAADLQIEFDTDMSGNVSGNWLVTAEQNHIEDIGPRPDLVSIIIETGSANRIDLSRGLSCCTDNHFVTSNTVGSWNRAVAPVPLSGGITLFSFALVSVSIARRFSRH